MNLLFDSFVARLDANLAFQWQLRIGSKHDDTITQLATTSTGDLLAVGFTTLDDANDTDGMIVRIGADATVRDAAFRVLADWPAAAAVPALVDVVRTPANDTQRTLALRGARKMQG